MLTGKCKEDFTQWFFKQFDNPEIAQAAVRLFLTQHFYGLPFEFQQGVYMAFFREQGIYINSYPNFKGVNNEVKAWCFDVYLRNNDDFEYDVTDTDYNLGFTHIITKANELINAYKQYGKATADKKH